MDDSTQNRVLIYASNAGFIGWLEERMQGLAITSTSSSAIGDVVTKLIDDTPPRVQVLIVDFDPLQPGDILHLHTIRERGWFGAIIALGYVPADLRRSLNIERVLPRPLSSTALRMAITQLGLHRATTRMARIPR